jgi:hypothetical protein
MRSHPIVAAVAAVAVLIATTFQYSAAAFAHVREGNIVIQGHHIKNPGPVHTVTTNNVRTFGATGNGVTDDSTAIQNAANDAAVRGVGVFFPAGTYLHASPVQFAGIPVSGVGSASVLVANNPANGAVILSGANVSLQNMTISSQGLAGATSPNTPNSATLLVQNATSFTVANDTIVTGTNMWGAFVLNSTVGAINSVVFDGTGNANDAGVTIDQGDNVTVSNCTFQNEAYGVNIIPNGGPSQFIAVVSNTIGTVAFPMTQFGVYAQYAYILDIAQNSMQMLNSSGTYPAALFNCNNFTVSGNDTWGGSYGFEIVSAGSNNNFVTQNTIHNSGAAGVYVGNIASSAIQVTSNVFGECGLVFPAAVIIIAGADASGANTFVQNNSYQGHLNNLTSYVQCTYTAPHIPAANVTGNTQTQTALGNSI